MIHYAICIEMISHLIIHPGEKSYKQHTWYDYGGSVIIC